MHREALVDVVRTGGTTFQVFGDQLQKVLESGCAIVAEKRFLPRHLVSSLFVEFAVDAQDATKVEKVVERGWNIMRGAGKLGGLLAQPCVKALPKFSERARVVAVSLEDNGGDSRR